MELNRKSNVLLYQNEIVDELFNTHTLVKVIKTCCEQREYSGDYYGIPNAYIPHISNERNEYISLLTIISDKLKRVNLMNLDLEKELTLH
jgi:mannitol/fructose-specific phosphotransferase system IIA component (Ntr-type)